MLYTLHKLVERWKAEAKELMQDPATSCEGQVLYKAAQTLQEEIKDLLLGKHEQDSAEDV